MEKTLMIIRDQQVNFILLIVFGLLIIRYPNLLAYMVGLYLVIAGSLNLMLSYKRSKKAKKKR